MQELHHIGDSKEYDQSKRSPDTFWAEAVNIAVYILNRSYTKAVKDMTPLQAFSGKKPSVSHFRILEVIVCTCARCF